MNISKKKMSSLLDKLDTVFVINGEMVEANGEDSYAYAVNDGTGMIGVFDGCGGIGSRKYPEYNNKSGAYIASRVAGNVTFDWFKKNCAYGVALTGSNVSVLCADLKKRLCNQFKAVEGGTVTSTMIGSLSKSFPTTASLILFSAYKNILYSSFIWAGDSRGFVLTEDGLCQITCDDIEEGTDALENLSADGKLTNLISADGKYNLHSRNVVCDNSAVYITATDGCFAYFSTPMEFEYMLVETLQQAENIEQWKANINQYIKKYTADDYTIGIAVCGYKSFKNLKKAYSERRMFLYENYISRLSAGDTDVKIALWNEYKKTYYRGV